MREPLPAHERARILDAVAHLLEKRQEDAARAISAEAGKPLKAARVEAQRAVSTFTFAAVEARKLAGEVVPMDASPAGEGKLAFTLRLPIGVVGAISPFNFPLNLVAHNVALGARRRLRRRAQARVRDPAVLALTRRNTRKGRPPAGLARRRGGIVLADRRRRGGRAREADHVHGLGEVGWRIAARATAEAREARARERNARDRLLRRARRTPRRSSRRTRSRSQVRAASPCSASS